MEFLYFFNFIQRYLFQKNKNTIFIMIYFFSLSLINSKQPYNSYFLEKFNAIVIIYQDDISFYSTSNISLISKYTIKNDEQKINSLSEAEMISFGYIYNNTYQEIYIIIKNYIYNFKSNKEFNSLFKIESINNNIPELIVYKCLTEFSYSYCFILIAFINSDNKLKILEYKHKLESEEYTNTKSNELYLINSLGGISKSQCDNVSCKIMVNILNKKVLTCFYENEDSQIGAMIINIETLEKYNSDIPSIKQNTGAINIKSVLLDSNQKAFVCYINNYKNIYCIIYNIIENKWGEEYKYIENIDLSPRYFNLDFFSNYDQHILSSFSTNYQVEYAMLKNQMRIIATSFNSSFCLTNLSLVKSKYNYFPILQYYYDDNINKLLIIYDYEKIVVKEISTKCNKNCEKQEIIVSEISIPTESLFSLINTDYIKPENEILDKKVIKRINKTIGETINELDDIMKEINTKEIIELKSEDYIIKISPINFVNFEITSTYINFSKCENTLRVNNNIPLDAELKVVMIEIEKNDDKALTNQVEYAIYYNDKKLDLSVCENDEIEINYEISNSSLLNLDLILKFSEMGVDILDSNNEFFIDICYPYAENNSDMILRDRIERIYQNYSVCDENCVYNKIDLDSNIITCKCRVKTELESSILPLRFDTIILDIITNSSFGVIKCYNLVFNFKTKLKNIGFWLFLFIILIHIPLIIHFFIFRIAPINKYILNEMKKYNYYKCIENTIRKIKRKKHMPKSRYKTTRTKKDILLHSHGNEINIYVKKDEKNISSSIIDLNNGNNKMRRKRRLKTTALFGDKKLLRKEKQKKSIKCEKLNKVEENKKAKEYFLIQINANNCKDNKPPESKIFLDNYSFEEAVQYDNRPFTTIYYICLLSKENILNLILIKSPLELKSIRFIVFIFIYSCDLALNTLFYFNDNISDKFYYEGDNIYIFSIFNNFFISFLSTFLSFSLVNCLQLLTNSKDSVEGLFRDEEKKMRKDNKYKVSMSRRKEILNNIIKINKKLKFKIIAFIIIEFSIMLFFYYFVTAFCEVYSETQISWIFDSLVSFILSFPMEFFYAFLIAIFYIISIKLKIKILYRIVMVFYSLG